MDRSTTSTLRSGHWARRPGADRGRRQRDGRRRAPSGLDHGGERPGPSTADGRRRRHVGLELGGRVGRARRDRGAARTWRATPRADALPVPRRRHRRRDRRGRSRGRPARCRGRDHRRQSWLAVKTQEAGRSRLRAVRGRVRRHRPVDVGGDRRERGQRRGRQRISPDRRAQEHRLHPGAGGRGVRGAGAVPGAVGCWAAWRSGTCSRCRCSARPRRCTESASSRAGFGGYRGAAADVRPGGHRGAAAGAAGGTAERSRGHRERARPTDRPRLRRAPTARQAAAPPPGDDRPGRPVRTAGPEPRPSPRSCSAPPR